MMSGRVVPAGALRYAVAGLILLNAGSAFACPTPPPVMKDLDIPRFYGDATGSVIDPVQKAVHDAAVTPLTDFVRTVTTNADKAHRRTKPADSREAATCTLAWITAWAASDGWLGHMAQAQAEYQRKWDLAGVALAYLKVKPYATPEQRRIVEPWLMRFADAARKFFDNPGHKRNNHWYWLGLAVGATALATDSERHWTMARGIMADAATDIAADGTLPMELARGRRALLYHTFAAVPLVTLAELAQSRGEDWYGLNGGALHRLVAVTTAGIADHALFEVRAGIAQDQAHWSGTPWLHLYGRRFPDRTAGWPMAQIKSGHRWLGGDVVVLGQVLLTRQTPSSPKG
jgi:poly(beta-D-mannuronate) lyase